MVNASRPGRACGCSGGCPAGDRGTTTRMVLAFDELRNTALLRARSLICPDCWADLDHEHGAASPVSLGVAASYRCTGCGAGWESNAAGWMFPSDPA